MSYPVARPAPSRELFEAWLPTVTRPCSSPWSTEQGFHADVYVFGLQTATTHEEYKPLDTAQWQFYVADQTVIEARAGAQMSLPTLARLCGAPHPYDQLADAIALTAERVRSLWD